MTNIPAPYRVEFFNQLSKRCDLTVFFEEENNKVRNKAWFKNNHYEFKYIFFKNIKKLFNILNDNYDLIIMGSYSTKISAIARFYLKYKKISYGISADGGFAKDKFIFTKWIKTFFISSATYWLSSGKETTKYLTYYGAKKENIYEFRFTSLNKKDILRKPITYEEKIKLRKKMGFDYKRIFLSVGQLVYRKGYDILLDLIKKEKFSKDAAFIIAGVGNKEKEYYDFIQKNNIKNVYFVGFKDKRDILDLYKMADVFFFPSREDIWGLVINEAMANGLPIISSNKTLASLELLDSKYIFDIDNQNNFRSLIQEYINIDNEILYKIGEKNLKIIENYNIEQMVEDHIQIFNELQKKKIN